MRNFLPPFGVATTQQRLSRACLDDSVARSTGFTAMWHTLFLSTLFQGDLALSSRSLLRWTQSSVVDDAPQVDVYLSLQRPQLAMCHPSAGSAATTTPVESTSSFLGDNIGIKVREMNWNNIEVKQRKKSTPLAPTRNSEPGSCPPLDVWKKWARVQALGGKDVVSQKNPQTFPLDVVAGLRWLASPENAEKPFTGGPRQVLLEAAEAIEASTNAAASGDCSSSRPPPSSTSSAILTASPTAKCEKDDAAVGNNIATPKPPRLEYYRLEKWRRNGGVNVVVMPTTMPKEVGTSSSSSRRATDGAPIPLAIECDVIDVFRVELAFTGGRLVHPSFTEGVHVARVMSWCAETADESHTPLKMLLGRLQRHWAELDLSSKSVAGSTQAPAASLETSPAAASCSSNPPNSTGASAVAVPLTFRIFAGGYPQFLSSSSEWR